MLISSGELFTLLVAIILGIWLCYRSRLKLLRIEAFAEHSRLEVQSAVNSLKIGVEGFRSFNDKFEEYNKNLKESNKIMCIENDAKICSLCGNGGDDCIAKKGGDE